MIQVSEILKNFKGRLTNNEKLAPFTTFKIGGLADYYAEPLDAEDLLSLLKYISENEKQFCIIGNGSNILVSDEGYRGFIINLEKGFTNLEHRDGRIICGAGVKLAIFVDFCINHHYAGVEMLAGIPGTMGGALIMNAGAYSGKISDHLESVKAVKNNGLLTIPKELCGFAYRNSNLQKMIVLEGTFSLPQGNQDELSLVRKQLILKRNEAQPVEMPNAGSIFKNPKENYAAKLIQECGLKGMRYGGAMISTKHTNFIVNYDRATANDIIELIKAVRSKVKDITGIELELEVKLVGFEEGVIK